MAGGRCEAVGVVRPWGGGFLGVGLQLLGFPQPYVFSFLEPVALRADEVLHFATSSRGFSEQYQI